MGEVGGRAASIVARSSPAFPDATQEVMRWPAMPLETVPRRHRTEDELQEKSRPVPRDRPARTVFTITPPTHVQAGERRRRRANPMPAKPTSARALGSGTTALMVAAKLM